MPNWVENLLVIEKVTPKRLEEIQFQISGQRGEETIEGDSKNARERPVDFNRITPMPPESDPNSEEMHYWRNLNWGTKWNSILCTRISPNNFFFLTAWDPPYEIIYKLGRLFPDATFKMSFSSESNFAGILKVTGFYIELEDSNELGDQYDLLRDTLRKLKHKLMKEQNINYY
ncbi:MAG: hypothetical protein WC388_00410 [Bacteroidales bacterium]|jgi:hypothetical protein